MEAGCLGLLDIGAGRLTGMLWRKAPETDVGMLPVVVPNKAGGRRKGNGGGPDLRFDRLGGERHLLPW